jgi:hypothetical protein
MKRSCRYIALATNLLLFHAPSYWGQPNTHPFVPHTVISAGPVSGVWTVAGSPYHISEAITIPTDSTLTIEPGVEVVFTGHYKLNVQGRLMAVGTVKDTIHFRSSDTQTGWHGVRFDRTPSTNDTSMFVYCSFKHGNANTGSGFDRSGGAMLIREFNKVLVSHCLFDSNSQSGEGWDPPEADGGIFIYKSAPTVMNSTFTNNVSSKSSAIGCVEHSTAVIVNNVFRNNRGRYGAVAVCYDSRGTVSGNTICNNVATEAAGGMLVDNGATPLITNNLIVHNQGFSGGITCYRGGKPILIGNTIAYNTGSYGGGAIGCRSDGDPVLINNILYGNDAPFGKEIGIDDDESDPVVLYCNVKGGREGIEGGGAGVNYTGLYEQNINVDPRFVNVSLGDYRLSDSSPCIGTGVDSIELSGVWHHAPSFCFGGNPRPSPAGSKPDIGACENLLGGPMTSVDERSKALPSRFALEQNYPNPFNPTTTINYSLPSPSHYKAEGRVGVGYTTTIKVYDLLGREVATLVDEHKPAGEHNVAFDGSRLPSGVYLYRLQAGGLVQTKKCILLE